MLGLPPLGMLKRGKRNKEFSDDEGMLIIVDNLPRANVALHRKLYR
jgi:hypothetical protein